MVLLKLEVKKINISVNPKNIAFVLDSWQR